MVMKERVSIKKKVKTKDDDGYKIDTLEDYYSCWAEINNLYGKELYEAYNLKLENTLNIKIKYCNKVKSLNNKGFILVWKDRKFRILLVDYLKYNKKDVLLKCIEVS